MVSSAVLPGQSPLAAIPAQHYETPKGSPGKVIISDAGAMDLINLRCGLDNRKVSNILKKLAGNGFAPANHFLQSGDRAIICLGPDEWLIMAEAGTSTNIMTALETAKAGHIATTEVSSAMGILTISGKTCRDVLAKHCAIDLDISGFKPGQASQTLLGHAGVILLAQADDQITLIGRSSFMPYLVALLVDAGLEYGVEYRPA